MGQDRVSGQQQLEETNGWLSVKACLLGCTSEGGAGRQVNCGVSKKSFLALDREHKHALQPGEISANS